MSSPIEAFPTATTRQSGDLVVIARDMGGGQYINFRQNREQYLGVQFPQLIEVELGPSEIIGENSWPIIPAAPAGKFLFIYGVVVETTGTTAYQTSAPATVNFSFQNEPSGGIALAYIDDNGDVVVQDSLVGASNQQLVFTPAYGNDIDRLGNSLNLVADGIAATGTSTFKIKAIYSYI